MGRFSGSCSFSSILTGWFNQSLAGLTSTACTCITCSESLSSKSLGLGNLRRQLTCLITEFCILFELRCFGLLITNFQSFPREQLHQTTPASFCQSIFSSHILRASITKPGSTRCYQTPSKKIFTASWSNYFLSIHLLLFSSSQLYTYLWDINVPLIGWKHPKFSMF